MNLSQAVAAFVLGMLPPERLPEIATSALERGIQSTSLSALADATPRADPRELRALFLEAVAELGSPPPSLLEAAETLKQYYAAQVVAGELPPREGARLIVERVFREVDELLPPGNYLGEAFGIAQLVGYFYNYDDVPSSDVGSIAEIDQAIIRECARIGDEHTT